MEILWLCGLSLLAGLIDSMVGGGGLIQLPALFLLLPAPLAASVATVLGTNKMASICGTGMALARYSRRIAIPWSSILPAGLAAFAFAFLGAMTVVQLETRFLRSVIVVLLIGVAMLTFVRKDMGRVHLPRFTARRERWFAGGFGMGIGFYDGFFGPGTGTFLLFGFTGGFGFDFLTATASAKAINFATNLAALTFFAADGHVLFRYALPMGCCNVLGAMAGTRMAMHRGNAFIRLLFLLVVGAMILRFGWQAWFSGH